MESLIQKWGWVAHLLFIALAAALMASAVTKYIAIQLAPLTVPELPKLAAAPAADQKATKKPKAQSLSRKIVERCWFGCPDEAPPVEECAGGCPDGQVCQSGTCVDSPDAVPAEQLVASDLGVKLQGLMVAREPEYSVAMFADNGGKATFIVGVGEMLMGQAEVIDIQRDRVIIRRSGRLEYIQLQDTLSGAPTYSSTIASLPPGATDLKRTSPETIAKLTQETLSNQPSAEPSTEKQEKKQEVTQVADGEFELDKASVEAELNDAKKIANGARVVPNYVDGQASGIKLVGVRGDSVYSKLGIESGDVVTSINGTKVKNQAHAFELLQGMRGKDNASIEIERRGESKTLKYRVK